MNEEEYFRKNYPDSCYGDKPLSPHWDFFQDGVEFGERESEEKIEDLEQKLEQTEKDLADYQFNYPTIKELQKENAELKSGCGMCYRKDKEQLTKAKELLRKILSEVRDEPQNYITSTTIAEAEQFLKGDE